jgi:hypothetical protein
MADFVFALCPAQLGMVAGHAQVLDHDLVTFGAADADDLGRVQAHDRAGVFVGAVVVRGAGHRAGQDRTRVRAEPDPARVGDFDPAGWGPVRACND